MRGAGDESTTDDPPEQEERGGSIFFFKQSVALHQGLHFIARDMLMSYPVRRLDLRIPPSAALIPRTLEPCVSPSAFYRFHSPTPITLSPSILVTESPH